MAEDATPPALPAGLELDEAWYVAHHADVAIAGLDARAHWRDHGAAEERLPCPEELVVRRSGLVDANYYTMCNDDVRRAGLDPVDHYCRYGIGERRRPNAYFDARFYEAAHGAPAAMGALAHYVLFGEKRGLRPSLLFDPAWYCATERVPPGEGLAHYLAHRRGGRVSPVPFFDVEWYVAHNAGAVRAGRDPFGHYLDASARRDVAPAPFFDAAAWRARRMPAGNGESALLHMLRTLLLTGAP